MELGTVTELWRYPVKSLGGESLKHGTIETQGLCGDRAWAVIDELTGDILNAKTCARLLELSAHYHQHGNERVFAAAVPSALINSINGQVHDSRSAGAQALLSEYVGRPVRLAPLEPAENLAHYRLSKAPDMEELARSLNIQAGEALPDFRETPAELMTLLAEYACPPGTYVDAYPLHLLTTASMAKLRQEGGGDASARRFRPNLIVQPHDSNAGFREFEWLGKTLLIGEVALSVDSRTIRCAMPARPQPQYQLESAPEVSRTLYRSSDRHLGVYLKVLKGGSITVGDTVSLE